MTGWDILEKLTEICDKKPETLESEVQMLYETKNHEYGICKTNKIIIDQNIIGKVRIIIS